MIEETEVAAMILDEFASKLRLPRFLVGSLTTVGTASGAAPGVVLGAETHAADPVPGHADCTITSYQGGHCWNNTGEAFTLPKSAMPSVPGAELKLLSGGTLIDLPDPVPFPAGVTITAACR